MLKMLRVKVKKLLRCLLTCSYVFPSSESM